MLTSARPTPRRPVEGEAARLADQLRRALSQPGVIADEAWLRRLYGEPPLRPRVPDADEVLAVPPGSLRAAHRRRVVPDGSLLVLVGDLTPARALDQVAAALAGWDASGTGPGAEGAAPRSRRRCCWWTGRARCSRTCASAGRHRARTDPAYAAAELANALFGGYFSSRLTMNIREDKGYTYSPRSALRHARAASRCWCPPRSPPR